MRKLFVSVFVFFLVLIFQQSAVHGFSYFRTPSGEKTHWRRQSNIVIRANEITSSRLSRDTVFDLLTTSLQRWQQVADNIFYFTYYQGNNSDRYPTQAGASNDSIIFFTSNADKSQALACGVVALTQVWFGADDGVISRFDMRFNDNCFEFTNDPKSTALGGKMYLPDIAVHELGHTLGVDHSGNLQSTMVPSAYKESFYPSCDDQAAVISLYNTAQKGQTGTLSGKIISSSSSGVFGAQVQVVDTLNARVLASTLTEKDGSFEFNSLAPGYYAVEVEPFASGTSAMGNYYSTMTAQPCGAEGFPKNIVSEPNGKVKLYAVTNQNRTDIGTYKLVCGPQVAGLLRNFDFTTSYVLDSPKNTSPTSIASVFTQNQEHYYFLANQSGYLKASAVSYALFSPANVRVDFLDATGKIINSRTSNDVFYSSVSGYTNYDSIAETYMQQPQNIFVRVRLESNLFQYQFPMSGRGMSNEPFYILTVTDPTSVASILTNAYNTHASCIQADRFSKYPDQGEAPANLGGGSNSSNDDSGFFGCGTIANQQRLEQARELQQGLKKKLHSGTEQPNSFASTQSPSAKTLYEFLLLSVILFLARCRLLSTRSNVLGLRFRN